MRYNKNKSKSDKLYLESMKEKARFENEVNLTDGQLHIDTSRNIKKPWVMKHQAQNNTASVHEKQKFLEI